MYQTKERFTELPVSLLYINNATKVMQIHFETHHLSHFLYRRTYFTFFILPYFPLTILSIYQSIPFFHFLSLSFSLTLILILSSYLSFSLSHSHSLFLSLILSLSLSFLFSLPISHSLFLSSSLSLTLLRFSSFFGPIYHKGYPCLWWKVRTARIYKYW